MATTKVADVVVPVHFGPYVIERTAELSELVQSGIIEASEQFNQIAAAGGQTVTMPFWQDLAGADEVLDDTNPLTPGKITASSDVAVINNRGKAWESNDLAGILAGDDPQQAIADLVASYWARRLQASTLSILKGIFTIASMAGNLHAIHQPAGATTEANYLTGVTFIDGAQKLGDAKDLLSAVIMHSAVEASLAKQDLIDFLPDSEGNMRIKVFQGKRVIVDDGMPIEVVDGKNVYSTFLFGRGALAMGTDMQSQNDDPEGSAPGSTWGTEFYRSALGGNSGLINRRRFILHPRGVKWLGAVMAGKSPTNTEFENVGNWLRVFEQKHIRIVKITHNIAP